MVEAWSHKLWESSCDVLQVLFRIASSKKGTLQGPVVQNIVSLISSLIVKMLTVLVSTISNSQVFLLKKRHIFSVKILVYMPYLKVLMIR